MTARPKILLFGYLPPPHFGPATAYQTLLQSSFADACDIAFINLSVVTDLRDLETFRPAKLLKLTGFLGRELRLLATRQFDFVCYPLSFNRNAFLKDALLLAVARRFGVPTVLWAHGNNLPHFYAQSSPALRRLIRQTIRPAAAAIVLGERLRFNFADFLPPDRIHVIPLGIVPPPATPRTPAGRTTVLYLGNLIREKGVFVLLEAARRCPQLRFVFAGNWFRPSDRRDAETHAPPNAEFIGPVIGPAKWQTLAAADLLAFPTYYHYETFGLVLLEAMAMGLPVVTTARASIPEIVCDGQTGLLVREQDPDDLAEKILLLAGNPELRQRLGAAGRQRFAEHYTAEHYAARMRALFQRLSYG